MLSIRAVRPAALSCLLIASTAFASGKHAPTPSTWKLNLQASDFGGAPAPKSDVELLLKDTSNYLSFEETIVEADGKTTKIVWSGKVDGKMYPAKEPKGTVSSWDDATDSGTVKAPDGSTMDIKLVDLNAKQTTFVQTVTDPAGHAVKQKLVYDRIK